MDMIKRPRRLRGGETIRKMVRETRMDKSSLIYPMFVQEGTGREDEIPSMPGQFRYTLDRLPYELERLAKAGVGSVMLFGIPDRKDEIASQAYAQDGIVQRALQVGKEKFPAQDTQPARVGIPSGRHNIVAGHQFRPHPFREYHRHFRGQFFVRKFMQIIFFIQHFTAYDLQLSGNTF